MRVLGTLALTIAMTLTLGASAQDCDFFAVASGGPEGEWLVDEEGLDQGMFDDADVYELEEGGSITIDLDAFGDVFHMVDGSDGDCEAIGEDGDGFWTAWDQEDGVSWDYPGDVADFDPPVGGGAGLGDFGEYGAFGMFNDSGFSVFLVVAPSGPNLSLSVVGNTYDEEGGDITMSANETMLPPYQWHKGGSDIGGATNATFGISGALIADSGTYGLTFDFPAKVETESNTVSVSIFAAGSLPVSGLIGLGLLAAVGALGGVVALRKKQ